MVKHCHIGKLLWTSSTVETYESLLPRGTVADIREKNGGVDSENFFEWATLFVQYRRDLSAGGRKILLLYDVNRAQIRLRVLKLFKANRIIEHAIPAHTSRKIQAFDEVCLLNTERR